MKKYPFSMAKHAHDIEFRRNRVFCLIHDSDECDEKLEDLYDELTDLLIAMMDSSRDGQVCFLTGKQIGLAKETVVWAANERAEVR